MAHDKNKLQQLWVALKHWLDRTWHFISTHKVDAATYATIVGGGVAIITVPITIYYSGSDSSEIGKLSAQLAVSESLNAKLNSESSRLKQKLEQKEKDEQTMKFAENQLIVKLDANQQLIGALNSQLEKISTQVTSLQSQSIDHRVRENQLTQEIDRLNRIVSEKDRQLRLKQTVTRLREANEWFSSSCGFDAGTRIYFIAGMRVQKDVTSLALEIKPSSSYAKLGCLKKLERLDVTGIGVFDAPTLKYAQSLITLTHSEELVIDKGTLNLLSNVEVTQAN